MCRHLGYLGPRTSVGGVLTDGEHSLRVQSYAPNDMRGGGTINADGFGVAWWQDGSVRSYRNPMPIWTDSAVDDVLPQLHSTSVIAAVRSATVGMPVERSACAPFTDGRWAFSHNGVVRGWPHSLTDLWSEVPAVDALTLPAPTDAAAAWIVLRQLLDTLAPPAALAALVRRIEARAPGSRLNFLLGDGENMYATAVHHALSVRRSDDAVTIASEPTDDSSDWTHIDDRSLVVATASEFTVSRLDEEEHT
ncbi:MULTISPECIES: ergothioneine biosynthesis protein EgtC [Nocardiaceae]|uniref:ergothioneine biosynthesis protein EgtC n=1 Tax=Nocardiaceae TaxID=85025 RepID=UPI00050CF5D6|nr:ergothioneine biosynthesis protein EgtC [Rhodococcus fascians]